MDNMSKSDLLNCQHSLTELILTGYAQKVMSKALKKYLLKKGSEKMIYIMTRAVDTLSFWVLLCQKTQKGLWFFILNESSVRILTQKESRSIYVFKHYIAIKKSCPLPRSYRSKFELSPTKVVFLRDF